MSGKTANQAGKIKRKAKRKAAKMVIQANGQETDKGRVSLPRSFPTSQSKALGNIVSGISQMSIPKDEQDRMTKFLMNNASSAPIIEYMGMLMNPKKFTRRYMDPFSRPTALARSITTFDVSCYLDTTPNTGRFAAAFQPTLGSPDGSDPSQWKTALVSGADPWPVDFTKTDSYTEIQGGRDLRVDTYFDILTQASNGFLNVFALTPALNNPFAMGISAANVASPSYGLGLNIGPGTRGYWFLPPGSYFGVITNTNPAATNNIITVLVPANLVILHDQSGSVDPTTTFLFNVQNVGEWMEIYFSNNTSTSININFCVVLTTNGGAPIDFGPVSQIRPVAFSVLASYIGTTLNDGGNIAAAYVPGGSLDANYFVDSTGVGALGVFQNWENLSLVPCSYNGPIRDGAYVWWSPEDVVDTEMLKPSLSNGHDYPTIVVSGQFLPGTVTVGSSPCMRVEVVTVYEFTTNQLCWEQYSCIGSAADRDLVAKLLSDQPHSMANKSHMSWFTNLMKDVGSGVGSAARFILDNAGKALPIIEKVGAML